MVSAAHPTRDGQASTSTSSAVNPTETRDRAGIANPRSDKRAAANRANARKSTGPRTAAGRARSRMNALKHGLCARVVLLPGEDWREYQAFAKEFADDLKPLGVIQEMLAGRAAALAWALRRLPDAASDLAERGEQRRFGRWFDGRGLSHKFDVLFSREGPGTGVPRSSPEALDEVIGAELAIARADGNPPPDDRDAAGIVADAVAGDDSFAAILKLEEHERRLWSALLSVLRALERRQKLDGRAEGGDAEQGEDQEKHPPETSEGDAPAQPVADTDPAPPAPTVAADESTTVSTVASGEPGENPVACEAERAAEGNDVTPDESGTSARCDVPSRGCAALRRGAAHAQRCAPARNEANEVGLQGPQPPIPRESGEPGA